MTEREKELIEAYIPSPPDPDLGFGEYYMRDSAFRVIRVFANQIASDSRGDEIRLAVRENGNLVFNAMGESWIPGWYNTWAFYDNKQDCRDNTHCLYNKWEELRQIQLEEQRQMMREENDE